MSSSDEIKAAKKALRLAVLEQRRAMSADFRSEADRIITEKVLAHPAFAAAKTVFAYVSMPHEVGTALLLQEIFAAGKTLGLPVCNMQSHTMQFYRLDALGELAGGAYRIPVPPASPERLLTPDIDTVMIVPMLSFDDEGHRLGAGGGYYDRFLAANRIQTIGICYADCKKKQLPADGFDLTLDCCITEQKTEDFYG